jgi:hypothetical protein
MSEVRKVKLKLGDVWIATVACSGNQTGSRAARWKGNELAHEKG